MKEIRIWNGAGFNYMSLDSFDSWVEYHLRKNVHRARVELKFEFNTEDDISNSYNSELRSADCDYKCSFDFFGMTPMNFIKTIESTNLKFVYLDYYKQLLTKKITQND